MKFKDFQYTRPDITGVRDKFEALLEKFSSAKSADEQDSILTEINTLRNNFDTMEEIISINYTIDTTNEQMEKEHDYFDDIRPVFAGLINKYYHTLLKSPYKEELRSKRGDHLFDLAEIGIKTYSPEILPDLKEENQLSSRYVKLMASAKIDFDGEERNLAGLSPYMSSPDREVRRKASEAYWKFFVDNEEELDEIYDKLVKVRDRIAKKLGYKNFIELGYARMRRTEYGPEQVADFRSHVLNYLVPLSTKLKEKQLKRLGLDELRHYDYGIRFKSGNPTPKGDPEWIVSNARDMYKDLSPDTDEFMSHMVDVGLMDLYNKKGKAPGGYCAYIPDYKSPFIFANMNGTSDDIRVLTHEAGHAFQGYCSRNFESPEYYHPTLEACEIHSMSMEYITWPWMKLFFKEDTEKFKVSHLEKSAQFIPYGVCVDHFQHYIYENPEATPAERKTKWRELEKQYMPYKDYPENDFLQRGGYWQGQGHIYRSPFYYIDYCLAEICAFQFWVKSLENKDKAWEDYLRLCQAGGSMSFLKLVELADIDSPFNEETVKTVVDKVEQWLDNVDESKLQ
ncbi:MAG TPA: M3 family oligoendopeptidase [Ignavibacteria bacterium]|nr:M3 family oligoendopeptidase [Ignavibacteria bacterium]